VWIKQTEGEVLAAGHERAEGSRRRGHSDRGRRWPEGLPRGDRRLPEDPQVQACIVLHTRVTENPIVQLQLRFPCG